ncbi:hypothetical protein BDV97DRAFT_341190 [Delphinella strobiligena]|nr:hypothetical protein BDV97DRAFT_341190 [Delphinella strobiligena]
MKSFAAVSVLALAASAAAAPSRFTRRQTGTCLLNSVNNPSQTQTEASINQWFSDVTTVNTFLNDAATFTLGADIQGQAETTLLSAQDEPCQLTTLSSIDGIGATDTSTQFGCAVQDLMNVFGPHVIDNLNDIINDPNDATVVHTAVDDINIFRCCNVLPDVDIIWQDSADDEGISNLVPTTAPREVACAGITCANVATASNCKSLPA